MDVFVQILWLENKKKYTHTHTHILRPKPSLRIDGSELTSPGLDLV